MFEKTELSVVIPVFNEAESLTALFARLSAVLDQLRLAYEVILVDDGSSDASPRIISQLNQRDRRWKGIIFSRNFGHMFALTAGLDQASGQAVITMDADLQHPPELIPVLLEKWRGGAAIVNTLRKEARDASLIKRLTAAAFYRLMQRIAKINLPQNAADFRLLDRKVVAYLKQIRERSRFLRGLISWVGFPQEFVEYQAEKRYAGQTKYSLRKMLSFALDGITSFSSFPLRLSTYFGLLVAFLSFLYIVYALYVRFFTSRAIEGWASVLVAVLFIGGAQLIFLGVIGEYLSRVYEETKARPLYLIREKVGLSD